MAKTPIQGQKTFPTTENEFYKAVETIAVQNVRAVKNTNKIEEAFYEYAVDEDNGTIIEEAVIEMAKAQAFVNTGNPDFSPKDPLLHVRYFNNFDPKQWEVSTRKNDIRKIVADKGTSAEEITAGILDTLTQGEGNYDYSQMRDIIKNEAVGADASTALFGGKVPSSSKGIIYCLREMYNAVKATNNIGLGDGEDFVQGVEHEDIRIALSQDVLNILDVTELANTFNLEKEELFGRLVVIPKDADYTASRVLVYDRKALGRATRVYEYSQDVVGKGLYMNSYLTTERAYFYNPIFKCLSLDIKQAFDAETAKLLTNKA